MDVSRIPAYMNRPVEKAQDVVSPGKTDDKSIGTRESSASQDRVQLSDRYREVELAKKVTMQQEEIRLEKVEPLRQAIKNGTYVVEPEKLAEKMMGEIW